ncbi:MAG: enoyl-ACP reductase FabI [Acidimicrobiia bacterium]
MLDGKRLLITGVLTDDSIAWHTARVAQEQGAEVVLTGFGRGLSLTRRSSKRLPTEADVYELDINDADHMDALVAAIDAKWGGLDGALHAIAFAPGDALGGEFLNTPAESASTAFLTSAFSYKTLAVGLRPLFEKAGGGAMVGLDFDNSLAWPAYDWMGVSKSALQSVNRYLANYLGEENVRVNLVSAGPLATVAAKSIPGFVAFENLWQIRAPLGWDPHDAEPVAKMACVLMSDMAVSTSGEIVHVDGGFHAVAAGPSEGHLLARAIEIAEDEAVDEG